MTLRIFACAGLALFAVATVLAGVFVLACVMISKLNRS